MKNRKQEELSSTSLDIRKKWCAPKILLLNFSKTKGKLQNVPMEGVQNGTNFCKIPGQELLCMNLGPS